MDFGLLLTQNYTESQKPRVVVPVLLTLIYYVTLYDNLSENFPKHPEVRPQMIFIGLSKRQSPAEGSACNKHLVMQPRKLYN